MSHLVVIFSLLCISLSVQAGTLPRAFPLITQMENNKLTVTFETQAQKESQIPSTIAPVIKMLERDFPGQITLSSEMSPNTLFIKKLKSETLKEFLQKYSEVCVNSYERFQI